MSFKYFLQESASEDRLKHLEHAEDHVIKSGKDGFVHAFHSLEDTHDLLQGKKSSAVVMTKYDGSPSIVFGHHPDTGKFFVASKSAWNVNPKVNYTEEDIDRNHGDVKGLAEKLKTALRHLPKITPKHGVYQGDMLHSGLSSGDNPQGDVTEQNGKFHFQANPSGIKYSTKVDSEEGKKIKKAKVGIVVHTAYKGDSFKDMKVDYAPDLSEFKNHPDVHRVDNRNDIKTANLTPDQSATYQHHMKMATEHYKNTKDTAYNMLDDQGDHLQTYINKTVREGTKPSHAGYVSHVKERLVKDISKLKTPAAIERKTKAMADTVSKIEKSREGINSIFAMHHHLQNAKDQLVHALSAKPKFEHSMGGTQTKPEGYVVVRNNRPTKLVDRAEFSKMNLLGRGR